MKRLLLATLFFSAVISLSPRAENVDEVTVSDSTSINTLNNAEEKSDSTVEHTAEKKQPTPFTSKILQAKKPPVVGSAVVSADPVSVVVGLLLVVALIVIVAWLLRRLGALPIAGSQAMRVLATLPLGTREKAVLVEVGGQQLLLGVAPGRVTHLQTFEQPVVSNNTGAGNRPKVDFSSTIKKILQQNNTASSIKNSSSNEKKGCD